MKIKQLKERLGGVVIFGAFLYMLSARFGNIISGVYFLIAFIVGSILIIALGNKRVGGRKIE